MNFPKLGGEDENDDNKPELLSTTTRKWALKLTFPSPKSQDTIQAFKNFILTKLQTNDHTKNNQNTEISYLPTESINKILTSPASTSETSNNVNSGNGLDLLTLFEPKEVTTMVAIKTPSQFNFDDIFELSSNDEDFSISTTQKYNAMSTTKSTSEHKHLNNENFTAIPVELLSVVEETQNSSKNTTTLSSSTDDNENTEKSDEFGLLETLSFDQDVEEIAKTASFQLTSTSSTTSSIDLIESKSTSKKSFENNENDDISYSPSENMENQISKMLTNSTESLTVTSSVTNFEIPAENINSKTNNHNYGENTNELTHYPTNDVGVTVMSESGLSAMNSTDIKLETWPELTTKILNDESILESSSLATKLPTGPSSKVEDDENMSMSNPELETITTYNEGNKVSTTLNEIDALFENNTATEKLSNALTATNAIPLEKASELTMIEGNKDLLTSNEFLTRPELTTVAHTFPNHLITKIEPIVTFASLSKEHEEHSQITSETSQVSNKMEILPHVLKSTHNVLEEFMLKETTNEDMVATEVDILSQILKTTHYPFIENKPKMTTDEDMVLSEPEKTIVTNFEENKELSTLSELVTLNEKETTTVKLKNILMTTNNLHIENTKEDVAFTILTKPELATTAGIIPNDLTTKIGTPVTLVTLSKEHENMPTQIIAQDSSKFIGKGEILPHESTHDMFKEFKQKETTNEDMIPTEPVLTTEVDILSQILKTTHYPFIESEPKVTTDENMILSGPEKTIMTNFAVNKESSTSSSELLTLNEKDTTTEKLKDILITTNKLYEETQFRENTKEDVASKESELTMIPTDIVENDDLVTLNKILTEPELTTLVDISSNDAITKIETITLSKEHENVATQITGENSSKFTGKVEILSNVLKSTHDNFKEFKLKETINEDMIPTEPVVTTEVDILSQILKTTHYPFIESEPKVTTDENMILSEPEKTIVTNFAENKESSTLSELLTLNQKDITTAKLKDILKTTNKLYEETQFTENTKEDVASAEPELTMIPTDIVKNEDFVTLNKILTGPELTTLAGISSNDVITKIETITYSKEHAKVSTQITSESSSKFTGKVEILSNVLKSTHDIFKEFKLKETTNEDMIPTEPVVTTEVDILSQILETTHYTFLENELLATTDEDMILQGPEKNIVTNFENNKVLSTESEHVTISTATETLPNIATTVTTNLSQDDKFQESTTIGVLTEAGLASLAEENKLGKKVWPDLTTTVEITPHILTKTTISLFEEFQPEETTVNEDMAELENLTTLSHTLKTTENLFAINELFETATDENMLSKETELTPTTEGNPELPTSNALVTAQNINISEAKDTTNTGDILSKESGLPLVVNHVEGNKELEITLKELLTVTEKATISEKLDNIWATTKLTQETHFKGNTDLVSKMLELAEITNDAEENGNVPIKLKGESSNTMQVLPHFSKTTHNLFEKFLEKSTVDEDMILKGPEETIATNFEENKVLSTEHIGHTSAVTETLPNIITVTISPPQENQFKESTDKISVSMEAELATLSEKNSNENKIWPDLTTTAEIAPHILTKTTHNLFKEFQLEKTTANEDIAPIEPHSIAILTNLPQILKSTHDLFTENQLSVSTDKNILSNKAELTTTIEGNNDLSTSNELITAQRVNVSGFKEITNIQDLISKEPELSNMVTHHEDNRVSSKNYLITLTEKTTKSENLVNISATTELIQDVHLKENTDQVTKVSELTESTTHVEENTNVKSGSISKSTHSLLKNFQTKETTNEDMAVTEPNLSTVVSVLPQISKITPNLFLQNILKKTTNNEDMGLVGIEVISTTSADENKNALVQVKPEIVSTFSSILPTLTTSNQIVTQNEFKLKPTDHLHHEVSDLTTSDNIIRNTNTLSFGTPVESQPHSSTIAHTEFIPTEFTVSVKPIESNENNHSKIIQNIDFSSTHRDNNLETSAANNVYLTSHQPPSGKTILTTNIVYTKESSSLNKEQSTLSNYLEDQTNSVLTSYSWSTEKTQDRFTSNSQNTMERKTTMEVTQLGGITDTHLVPSELTVSVKTHEPNTDNRLKPTQNLNFESTHSDNNLGSSAKTNVYSTSYEPLRSEPVSFTNNANTNDLSSSNKEQSTPSNYGMNSESSLSSSKIPLHESTETSSDSEELSSKINGNENGDWVTWPEMNSTSDKDTVSTVLTKFTITDLVNTESSNTNSVTEIFQDVIGLSTTSEENSTETSPTLPEELKVDFNQATIENTTNLPKTSTKTGLESTVVPSFTTEKYHFKDKTNNIMTSFGSTVEVVETLHSFQTKSNFTSTIQNAMEKKTTSNQMKAETQLDGSGNTDLTLSKLTVSVKTPEPNVDNQSESIKDFDLISTHSDNNLQSSAKTNVHLSTHEPESGETMLTAYNTHTRESSSLNKEQYTSSNYVTNSEPMSSNSLQENNETSINSEKLSSKINGNKNGDWVTWPEMNATSEKDTESTLLTKFTVSNSANTESSNTNSVTEIFQDIIALSTTSEESSSETSPTLPDDISADFEEATIDHSTNLSQITTSFKSTAIRVNSSLTTEKYHLKDITNNILTSSIAPIETEETLHAFKTKNQFNDSHSSSHKPKFGKMSTSNIMSEKSSSDQATAQSKYETAESIGGNLEITTKLGIGSTLEATSLSEHHLTLPEEVESDVDLTSEQEESSNVTTANPLLPVTEKNITHKPTLLALTEGNDQGNAITSESEAITPSEETKSLNRTESANLITSSENETQITRLGYNPALTVEIGFSSVNGSQIINNESTTLPANQNHFDSKGRQTTSNLWINQSATEQPASKDFSVSNQIGTTKLSITTENNKIKGTDMDYSQISTSDISFISANQNHPTEQHGTHLIHNQSEIPETRTSVLFQSKGDVEGLNHSQHLSSGPGNKLTLMISNEMTESNQALIGSTLPNQNYQTEQHDTNLMHNAVETSGSYTSPLLKSTESVKNLSHIQTLQTSPGNKLTSIHENKNSISGTAHPSSNLIPTHLKENFTNSDHTAYKSSKTDLNFNKLTTGAFLATTLSTLSSTFKITTSHENIFEHPENTNNPITDIPHLEVLDEEFMHFSTTTTNLRTTNQFATTANVAEGSTHGNYLPTDLSHTTSVKHTTSSDGEFLVSNIESSFFKTDGLSPKHSEIILNSHTTLSENKEIGNNELTHSLDTQKPSLSTVNIHPDASKTNHAGVTTFKHVIAQNTGNKESSNTEELIHSTEGFTKHKEIILSTHSTLGLEQGVSVQELTHSANNENQPSSSMSSELPENINTSFSTSINFITQNTGSEVTSTTESKFTHLTDNLLKHTEIIPSTHTTLGLEQGVSGQELTHSANNENQPSSSMSPELTENINTSFSTSINFITQNTGIEVTSNTESKFTHLTDDLLKHTEIIPSTHTTLGLEQGVSVQELTHSANNENQPSSSMSSELPENINTSFSTSINFITQNTGSEVTSNTESKFTHLTDDLLKHTEYIPSTHTTFGLEQGVSGQELTHSVNNENQPSSSMSSKLPENINTSFSTSINFITQNTGSDVTSNTESKFTHLTDDLLKHTEIISNAHTTLGPEPGISGNEVTHSINPKNQSLLTMKPEFSETISSHFTTPKNLITHSAENEMETYYTESSKDMPKHSDIIQNSHTTLGSDQEISTNKLTHSISTENQFLSTEFTEDTHTSFTTPINFITQNSENVATSHTESKFMQFTDDLSKHSEILQNSHIPLGTSPGVFDNELTHLQNIDEHTSATLTIIEQLSGSIHITLTNPTNFINHTNENETVPSNTLPEFTIHEDFTKHSEHDQINYTTISPKLEILDEELIQFPIKDHLSTKIVTHSSTHTAFTTSFDSSQNHNITLLTNPENEISHFLSSTTSKSLSNQQISDNVHTNLTPIHSSSLTEINQNLHTTSTTNLEKSSIESEHLPNTQLLSSGNTEPQISDGMHTNFVSLTTSTSHNTGSKPLLTNTDEEFSSFKDITKHSETNQIDHTTAIPTLEILDEELFQMPSKLSTGHTTTTYSTAFTTISQISQNTQTAPPTNLQISGNELPHLISDTTLLLSNDNTDNKIPDNVHINFTTPIFISIHSSSITDVSENIHATLSDNLEISSTKISHLSNSSTQLLPNEHVEHQITNPILTIIHSSPLTDISQNIHTNPPTNVELSSNELSHLPNTGTQLSNENTDHQILDNMHSSLTNSPPIIVHSSSITDVSQNIHATLSDNLEISSTKISHLSNSATELLPNEHVEHQITNPILTIIHSSPLTDISQNIHTNPSTNVELSSNELSHLPNTGTQLLSNENTDHQILDNMHSSLTNSPPIIVHSSSLTDVSQNIHTVSTTNLKSSSNLPNPATQSLSSVNPEQHISNNTHTGFITPPIFITHSTGSEPVVTNTEKESTILEDIIKHSETNQIDHTTSIPKLEVLDEELIQFSNKLLTKHTTGTYYTGVRTSSTINNNTPTTSLINLELSSNKLHLSSTVTKLVTSLNIYNGTHEAKSDTEHNFTHSETGHSKHSTLIPNLGTSSNNLLNIENQQISNNLYSLTTNIIHSTGNKFNLSNTATEIFNSTESTVYDDLSKHAEINQINYTTVTPKLEILDEEFIQIPGKDRFATKNITQTTNHTNLTTSSMTTSEFIPLPTITLSDQIFSDFKNENDSTNLYTTSNKFNKTTLNYTKSDEEDKEETEYLKTTSVEVSNEQLNLTSENTNRHSLGTESSATVSIIMQNTNLITNHISSSFEETSSTPSEFSNLTESFKDVLNKNLNSFRGWLGQPSINDTDQTTILSNLNESTLAVKTYPNVVDFTTNFSHFSTFTHSTFSHFQNITNENNLHTSQQHLRIETNRPTSTINGAKEKINDTDQTTILSNVNESTLAVKTYPNVVDFSTNFPHFSTHSTFLHFQNITNENNLHTSQQHLGIETNKPTSTINGAKEHQSNSNQNTSYTNQQELDHNRTTAPVTTISTLIQSQNHHSEGLNVNQKLPNVTINQEIHSSVTATSHSLKISTGSCKSKTKTSQSSKNLHLITDGGLITNQHDLNQHSKSTFGNHITKSTSHEISTKSKEHKLSTQSTLLGSISSNNVNIPNITAICESTSTENINKIQNETSGVAHNENKSTDSNGLKTSNVTTNNLKSTCTETEEILDEQMWNWPEVNHNLTSNGTVNPLTGDHAKVTVPEVTFASAQFEPAENDILFSSKPNFSSIASENLPITPNLHQTASSTTTTMISKSKPEVNQHVPSVEIHTPGNNPILGNKNLHQSNDTLNNAPIYINLPVYPVDSTYPLLLKFNEYYSSTTSSVIIDDEATDRVLNTEQFRTMKLEDFNIVTEFPITTILAEESTVSKLSDTNQPFNESVHLTTALNQALKTDHIEHNQQTVELTTKSEINYSRKAEEKPNQVLNESIQQNHQNAEITTKSETVHLGTTEEKITHIVSNGVTEILSLGSSIGVTHIQNTLVTSSNALSEVAGSEEIDKTSALSVLNPTEHVTEHSPPVMIISEFPKFQEESTCNYTDYLSQNNCMCSMDNLIKDLRMNLVNNFLNFSIDNFTCPIFTHVEAGIFLGNDSVPQIAKPKRDVSDMYSIVVRRETVEYQNMDKTLNEQLELKNTENDIFATPGMKILIPCISSNNLSEGSTNYSWTFSDNLPLTEGKIQETEGTLTIDHVAPQDAGNYTCIATSSNANKSDEKRYEHHLSVVSIPSYRLQTTLLYNSTEKCQSGDPDIISLYLPNSLEGLICGNYFKVCSIEVKNPKCLNATQYTSVNLTVVIEPINVIMPAINNSVCDVGCEMKIYTHVVLFIIKNLEAVLKLPVFFRLSYRQQKLIPTEVVIKKTKQKLGTEAPKLIITCPPGFGYYKRTHICGTCGRNAFSRGDETFCSPCPAGQYQPMVGSKSCLICATPLQDPYCLRVMYSNTHKFRVLIGITVTVLVIIVIFLLCIKSMKKSTNSKSNTKFGRESYLKNKRQSKRRNRDFDVEMQDSQPLLDSTRDRKYRGYNRKPPEPPPPDFY